MKIKSLKIGLDFHGVINEHYKFFEEFTSLALARGHKIFVISGGKGAVLKKELAEHNIKYSELYSLYDYFSALGLVETLSDGRFYVDETLWNKQKAIYCLEQKIDVHIDDSIGYLHNFETDYYHCNPEQKKCFCSCQKEVPFFVNPHLALQEIEKTFG
ncbi:MAG: hypothetical protein PHE89_05540 [Alphaproteobacteria bacterium]|nr:hypothetical protein [Alphaproteobacteria bacterium]